MSSLDPENPYAQPSGTPSAQASTARPLRQDEREQLTDILRTRGRRSSVGEMLYAAAASWMYGAVFLVFSACVVAVVCGSVFRLAGPLFFQLFLLAFACLSIGYAFRDFQYLRGIVVYQPLFHSIVDYVKVERLLETGELPGEPAETEGRSFERPGSPSA